MPAVFFAVLTILAHAAFTLVLKGTVHVWPVGLAGTFSRLLTLCLLGTWVLSRGAGWRRLRPGGMLHLLLVMGAQSIAVNLLWFGSLRFTTATNVAMLMSMDLVFVVLIGAALGLERLTARELALLPVLLAGMALLVGVAEKDLGLHLLGDLMAVSAAAMYASNAFVIRRILRHMDEESVSLYNHGLSTFGFLVVALLAGEFSQAGPIMSTPSAWIWIAVLGCTAALSLPLYYAALHRMEVWRLRAWLLAAPVLVAITECVLGVRLGLSQWLGAALVLGGIGLLIRMELRARRAATTTSPGTAPASPQTVSPDVSPLTAEAAES